MCGFLCNKVRVKVHCMFIVIPDAANASEARFGKEERKTKDEVDEKEVPSPDSLRTTFPLGGFVSCEQ